MYSLFQPPFLNINDILWLCGKPKNPLLRNVADVCIDSPADLRLFTWTDYIFIIPKYLKNDEVVFSGLHVKQFEIT